MAKLRAFKANNGSVFEVVKKTKRNAVKKVDVVYNGVKLLCWEDDLRTNSTRFYTMFATRSNNSIS